jgi:hypothetical protein
MTDLDCERISVWRNVRAACMYIAIILLMHYFFEVLYYIN